MSDYDVTDLDRAVSWAMYLSDRTEHRDGVHRYVMSDVRVERMVRRQFGPQTAADAMRIVRAGEHRLLRAPLGRDAYPVGKQLGYRTVIR